MKSNHINKRVKHVNKSANKRVDTGSPQRRQRLLLITDAWVPQTNGVVTTLSMMTRHLPAFGIDVEVIHPGMFKTWPLPSYPEIRVARNIGSLKEFIQAAAPDSIHIATEGLLGLAARRYCRRHGYAFTTSLHTKFPEYVNVRFGLPLKLGYRALRWFHSAATNTMVTTESHRQELHDWGLRNLAVWSRGVDTQLFVPDPDFIRKEPPRLLYVGRVAVEKNIEAFLQLDLHAQKVVVGDGPARAELQAKYPDAVWLGYRKGEALVQEYAAADAFVFPSRTDTFGLVMLEAMACGTPVAAYPVTGPIDVVQDGVNGWLHNDLGQAIADALQVDRRDCRRYAQSHDWQAIAQRLGDCLVDLDGRPLLTRSVDMQNKLDLPAVSAA
ncbi:MAG: glycosyltransferase family 1 protein [Pseudomonadota bacterium]